MRSYHNYATWSRASRILSRSPLQNTSCLLWMLSVLLCSLRKTLNTISSVLVRDVYLHPRSLRFQILMPKRVRSILYCME